MSTELSTWIAPRDLVPVGEVKTLFSAGWGKEHFLAWRAKEKLLLAEKTIREYNFYVRQIRREVRAIHDLFGEAQFTLIDSPHISVKQDPRRVPKHLRDKGPPSPRATTAELREVARKNRVDLRVLWDRFPPSTPAEFKQRAKDLAKFNRPIQVEEKKKLDPLLSFLTSSAKLDAKATGADYRAFLSDTEWKATKAKQFAELQNLVAGLEIVI